MSQPELAVTVDIDWASESAIEETISGLGSAGVPLTLFSTHHSPSVQRALAYCEVGVHPYFSSDSSQGESADQVLRFINDLPRNLSAFRCHRYLISNEIRSDMIAAGFSISSNVCSDLQSLPPFSERSGLLEYPVFLEDGGLLLRGHSLDDTSLVMQRLTGVSPAVVAIHPMHFVLNSPNFAFMRAIKERLTREEWNRLSMRELRELRWNGRGVRNFIDDLVRCGLRMTTIGRDAQKRSIHA